MITYLRLLAISVFSVSLSVWVVPVVFADQAMLTQEILPMYCESQLVMDGTRTELQITPGCERIVQDAQAAAAGSEIAGINDFSILLGTSENHEVHRASLFQKEIRCEVTKVCIDIALSKIPPGDILAYL